MSGKSDNSDGKEKSEGGLLGIFGPWSPSRRHDGKNADSGYGKSERVERPENWPDPPSGKGGK